MEIEKKLLEKQHAVNMEFEKDVKLSAQDQEEQQRITQYYRQQRRCGGEAASKNVGFQDEELKDA